MSDTTTVADCLDELRRAAEVFRGLMQDGLRQRYLILYGFVPETSDDWLKAAWVSFRSYGWRGDKYGRGKPWCCLREAWRQYRIELRDQEPG